MNCDAVRYIYVEPFNKIDYFLCLKVADQTLKFFHLLPYRNVLVKNLSGGNRRKLSVAVTCFGSSSNVLMDEPSMFKMIFFSSNL